MQTSTMRLRYIISGALLSCGLSLLLGGCSKEEELVAPDFKRLNSTLSTQTTETDKWISENLTKPYNIEILWHWDAKEVPMNKSYIPPYERNVLPYAKILKGTFLKTYEQVKGKAFIAPLVPKQFLFLGEWGYNNDGTITLGQAESGTKITFFGVNHWDEKDGDDYPQIREAIHTLYHEFAHILHQNKLFSEEYEKISKADYTAQWFNENETSARTKGFISSYSMLSKEEDFVEIIAFYCTMTPEAFNSRLTQQIRATKEDTPERAKAEEGLAKLQQKLTIIKDYLKSSWEIDIDELRDVTLTNVREAFKDPTIFPQAPASAALRGSALLPSSYSVHMHTCGFDGLHGVSHDTAPEETPLQ